ARCATTSGATSLAISWPVFTRDPRSTSIEFTYAVTFGNTATDSYACSSPGSLTVMASFLDVTFTTSTGGGAAEEAWAAPGLVFDPHEAQISRAMLKTRKTEIQFRLMPRLRSVGRDFVRLRLQMSSLGPRGRVTANAHLPSLERSRTPT